MIMLVDLIPIFATLLVVVAGLMRQQHVDNTKTRDLIDKTSKENRDLIEKKSDENRELIDRNRDLIEKYHLETAASIGEVRERLARIEGHLEIRPTPPPDDATAEAA
ncbi:hypothetical protein [Candidatus Poriferisocius sp.]|uniref:hypothetical protein n=1 Tax=Candidatus Poriferisocius sp. TaxID=3101276 RepID=UPI003B012C25